MSDKKKDVLDGLNIIDVFVRKTWMCLAHIGGRPAKLEVSCRDINVVLEENPVLLERYPTLLCFNFYDKYFTKVNIGGQEVNMESSDDPTNNTSPQFFFPGRGRFYTMEELVGKEDTLSETLVANMNAHGVKVCFLDTVVGRNFITVDLERGDRFLDESEIKDFGQKPKSAEIKLVPAEATSEAPSENSTTEKKREPKILFPITPEKNPVN
jgi:hypothetical protein